MYKIIRRLFERTPLALASHKNQKCEGTTKQINLPPFLRGQIAFLVEEALGNEYIDDEMFRALYKNKYNPAWVYARRAICKELGAEHLHKAHISARDDVLSFIRGCVDAEKVMVAVEVCFVCASGMEGNYSHWGCAQNLSSVTKEFNARCQTAGFPYQFIDDMMVLSEGETISEEVLEPTIEMLRERRFGAPLKEIKTAFKHLREQAPKEAIIFASNALESVVKIACKELGIKIRQEDVASSLLNALLRAGIFPNFYHGQARDIKKMLCSGVFVCRNNSGGHGDGENIKRPSMSLAKFAVSSACCDIQYIIDVVEEQLSRNDC